MHYIIYPRLAIGHTMQAWQMLAKVTTIIFSHISHAGSGGVVSPRTKGIDCMGLGSILNWISEITHSLMKRTEVKNLPTHFWGNSHIRVCWKHDSFLSHGSHFTVTYVGSIEDCKERRGTGISYLFLSFGNYNLMEDIHGCR